MNIKSWFLSKKLWLRGGIIGAVVCIVLFLFELFVYLPAVDKFYEDAGGPPPGSAIPLFVTGHVYLIFAGFISEPARLLCKFTEPFCASWSAVQEPGSEPWKLETGEAGYCVLKTMTPTTACANFAERVWVVWIAALLLGIYFSIGAIIGLIIQKIKRK